MGYSDTGIECNLEVVLPGLVRVLRNRIDGSRTRKSSFVFFLGLKPKVFQSLLSKRSFRSVN